jgi:hypothetical protein
LDFGAIFWTIVITAIVVSNWVGSLKSEEISKIKDENKNLKEKLCEQGKNEYKPLNSREKTDYFNLYQREESKKFELLDKISELEDEKNVLKNLIKEKETLSGKFFNDISDGMKYLSELISDYLTVEYETSANNLENKKHPAYTEAKRIRELKIETKEIIQKSKLMQYKYEYLFKLFPDLELYADNLNAIKELGNFSDIDEMEENIDRTRHYLSKEEWEKLGVDERNQLALKRYIEGRKNNWQIGRDYEMYIGYEYENDGWNVEYLGIEKQLEDMGRDLIARKHNQVHIVQCKYWSQNKTIHEKHIAQLYGTTVQYIISNNSLIHEVTPVFITNINLSDTARDFAKYLKVKVIEGKKFKEFPRIKCNLNKDEYGLESKIYHLPMDQQYDRTKICKNGECYTWTVKEAVDKGFRRAKRYFGE